MTKVSIVLHACRASSASRCGIPSHPSRLFFSVGVGVRGQHRRVVVSLSVTITAACRSNCTTGTIIVHIVWLLLHARGQWEGVILGDEEGGRRCRRRVACRRLLLRCSRVVVVVVDATLSSVVNDVRAVVGVVEPVDAACQIANGVVVFVRRLRRDVACRRVTRHVATWHDIVLFVVRSTVLASSSRGGC